MPEWTTIKKIDQEQTFRFNECGDLFVKITGINVIPAYYRLATGGSPLFEESDKACFLDEDSAASNTSGFSWKKPQRGRNKQNKLSPKSLFD